MKKKITCNISKDIYYAFGYECHLNNLSVGDSVSNHILTKEVPSEYNMYSKDNIARFSINIDTYCYNIIKKSKLTMNNYIEYIMKSNIENKTLDFLEESKEYYKNKKNKRKKHKIGFSKEYNDKVKSILINYKLTQKEKEFLEDAKVKFRNNIFIDVLDDIYILYSNKYSPREIGEVYGKTDRVIQNIINKLGLSRNKFEAQAIAKTKRNYNEIAHKGRITMTKRNTVVNGSEQENYLRCLLSASIPLHIKECDVIVGLNNRSILGNGLEVDIPIIIIKNDNIYKFAVEYDGAFWHLDREKDLKKDELLKKKGYTLFRVGIHNSKGFKTENQIKKYIEAQVENIINQIKELTKDKFTK